MALRIRKLALRVVTSAGDYGAEVAFPDGLVVLRADNSAGKSTCIQSIFYALGLEGMWSASHDIPLPHAMTDHLDDGGHTVAVVRSETWLEIENGASGVMTVKRDVKGGTNTHLISTWNGAKLSDPECGAEQVDYFVRESGAATRPRGFHHLLAGFVGWDLPQVLRFNGDEGPLYLECVCPLFVVEQKKGWSSLHARVPGHYRIRDVYLRVVEFLLRLDVYENERRRQRLRRTIAELREEWTGAVSACQVIAGQVNGSVSGLPSSPVGDWDAMPEPSLQVFRDNWLPLAEVLASDRAALDALTTEELPRVEQVTEQVKQRLLECEDELRRKEVQLWSAHQDVENERGSREGIERRLDALRDDLRKNQDVVRLRTLGSVSATQVSSGYCPTCHQPVNDSLLADPSSPVMSVEENVEFIRAQIETFTSALAESSRAVETGQRMVAALRTQVEDLRGRIRDLRRSLIADGRLPSLEAMRRRILHEQQVALGERVELAFAEQLEKLQSISERVAIAQSQMSEIPSEGLSADDQDKLRRVETLFRTQLREYGFDSVPPSTVSISRDSYRPEHEGFDLDFDLSASDMIRAIWAYFYSFLAVARDVASNHPGLLVFDEPRQQETARASFQALLKRAATAGTFGQQVIIATSEEPQVLAGLLAGLPHHLVAVEGKIIKRRQ